MVSKIPTREELKRLLKKIRANEEEYDELSDEYPSDIEN